MENNIINTGIIGAGRMGITHFSIINSHPKVLVKSVTDPSGIVLNIMKKYIPQLSIYKDYKQMLDAEELDAVLVCTPPNYHFEIIKECAEKDIHVFAEKPFTLSYQHASELAFLFRMNNLVNQVGYVNRFNDIFIKTKELLKNHVIGNTIRFKSEMFSCTITKSDESSGWRSSRDNGGGAVYEMAAHAIDLVNYLIGNPDKVVGSSLNHIYSKNVEDAVSSTFLYNNGTSGTIYINWSDESYRKPTNKLEIFGSMGKILADQHSLKIFLKDPNTTYNLRKGWNTLYITDIFKPVPFYVRGNEFTRQLYHFADCILSHNPENLCSFEEGAKTLKVIESIFSDYENNIRN
jgi:scyllo-inositol 2-dehydrogenase (NADP+)